MDLEEAQLSIIEKIAKAKYPSDHPFTNELFINDFYCKALSIFLMFSKEEDIIDDLITKKLRKL